MYICMYMYIYFLMKERDALSNRADIIVMNDKFLELTKLK